jgi:cysteine desulfurase/selenocysteine lyase
MKIDQIKKEFPIFDEKIQNNDLVYLDSANSSQNQKLLLIG